MDIPLAILSSCHEVDSIFVHGGGVGYCVCSSLTFQRWTFTNHSGF